MTRINRPPPYDPPVQAGMVVSRPRPTDAIGTALDSAFAAPRSLPAEFAVAIVKLDALR